LGLWPILRVVGFGLGLWALGVSSSPGTGQTRLSEIVKHGRVEGAPRNSPVGGGL